MRRIMSFGIVLSFWGSLWAQAGKAEIPTQKKVRNPIKYHAQSQPEWADTFISYLYSSGELTIFSYEDGTEILVIDDEGSVDVSGVVDSGQAISSQVNGVCSVKGNNDFTIMNGHPIADVVSGWFAVAPGNRGTSRSFLTSAPGNWGEDKTVVFSYTNNTVVTIQDFDSGTLIDSVVLDSAGHWETDESNVFLSINANEPVSVLSYSDQGYWVPSSNGTFLGNLFYTWVGYNGSWQNDLNLISYEDNTNIKVTSTETETTIWEGSLNEGEVHTIMVQNQYIAIESDEGITCLVAPYESFSSAYGRFYIGMDETGSGIGRRFFHPTITGSDMYIFSYFDDNQVKVYIDESMVRSEMLDKGENIQITGTNVVYRIESERPVSVYDITANDGIHFSPVWLIPRPALHVGPDQFQQTTPGTPVSETPQGFYDLTISNNGNRSDCINIELINGIDFQSEIYDTSGSLLHDTDGDGRPDTGELDSEGGEFYALIDVFPSDSIEIGVRDTCYVVGYSMWDESIVDTSLLITVIVESVAVEETVTDNIIKCTLNGSVLEITGLSLHERTSIDLFDPTGRRMHASRTTGSSHQIDISGIPQGVYFIKVQPQNHEPVVRKVIIY